jgi:hypothetical protein
MNVGKNFAGNCRGSLIEFGKGDLERGECLNRRVKDMCRGLMMLSSVMSTYI